MINQILNPEIQQYILDITTLESDLLRRLREDTLLHTALPNMLSGPVEGQLLQMLVRLCGARTCLEIGTFTGYATLHIAHAMPSEGRLITCEVRPHHAQFAQKYFDLSPDGHKIEMCLGDAKKIIPQLNHAFDFIFLDADKIHYPLYYDLLIPKLNPGGLMVVDNALWKGQVITPGNQQAQAIDALNRKAREDHQVTTVMLSVRDGILLIHKH